MDYPHLANEGVVQIRMPIELDGPGDVVRLIQQNVFVAFRDANVRIIQMIREPLGTDERLRMRVSLRRDRGICRRRLCCGHGRAPVLADSRSVRDRLMEGEQNNFSLRRHRAEHEHFARESSDATWSEIHRGNDLSSDKLLGGVVHGELRT